MKKMPIADFISAYNKSGTVRLHMPGHKGALLTGAEAFDITEISGADALFEAQGIIGESEANMSKLYGSRRTLYSTEGSSLSIKAMLASVRELFGDELRIAASRNCHRAFVNGCILLGIQPVWIYPMAIGTRLCSSAVTAHDVRRMLEADDTINAVYLTSPDYFGCMADIRAIAEVCHEHKALLLIDNAHGAYLKFAGEGLHPLDLGADMCADSAHKTLPALTGASLLHISKSAPEDLALCAKEAMLLFASTSPSYVIMTSLDRCAGELSPELSGSLPQEIRRCCAEVAEIKGRLLAAGFELIGDEPMKLTVSAKGLGYGGEELAAQLRKCRIEPEYCDPDCIVLMPSPYNAKGDLQRLADALIGLPARAALDDTDDKTNTLPRPKAVMDMRTAYFSAHERISIDEAAGRVCARAALSCQPSVPVIFGGEVITEDIIKIFKKYSIFQTDVVK